MHPHLFRAHVPFLFYLGPTLYLFFQTQFASKTRWQKQDIIHFIPGALATLALVPFYIKSSEEKLKAVKTLFIDFQLSPYDIPVAVGMLLLIGYVLFMVKTLSPLLTMKNLKTDFNLRLFLGLFLLILVTIFSSIISVVFRKVAFTENTALSISFILVLIYFFQKRYPEFFQQLNVSLNEEKYRRSLLTSVNLDRIKEKLEQLKEHEQFFLDEEISLAGLADRVGLSTHQLSEYLNSKLEVNFFTYINSLRIDEACKRLVQEKDKPVLTIAYEVGFNSKSSFHTAFVKKVGKTPSEFRKGKA